MRIGIGLAIMDVRRSGGGGNPNTPATALSGWNDNLNLGTALFQLNPAHEAYSDTGFTSAAVDGGNILGIKDLSGQGRDWIDSGHTLKPKLVLAGDTGKPEIFLDASSYPYAALNLVTGARGDLGNLGSGVSGRTHTLYGVFSAPNDGSYHCPIDNNGTSADVLNYTGTITRFGAGGAYDNVNNPWATAGVQFWASSYDNGTGIETMWVNGKQVYQKSGGMPVAGSADPWAIGNRMDTNFGLGGGLRLTGGWLGTIDPADSATIATFFRNMALEALAPTVWHLLGCGNSIMAHGWVEAIQASLGTKLGCTNAGWSGKSWGGLQVVAPTREDLTAAMLSRFIAVVYEWTNTMSLSAVQNVANADAYLADRVTAGYGTASKPIMLVGPLSCSTDTDGAKARAIRTAMLARCDGAVATNLYPAKAGETHFNYYYDLTVDANMGAMNDATSPAYSNTTYFSDGIHPTLPTGQNYIAALLAPAATYIMTH